VTGPAGVFIEGLSWDEVEQALPGRPVALLPHGARCKEHGRHLPLNNDYLMAEHLAAKVVPQCPVLGLPTLGYGFYPAFLEYPGSASIRAATSCESFVDIARSFAGYGLRKLYVLNTGISTERPLRAARRILAEEGLCLEYTRLGEALDPTAEGLEEQRLGSHADEIETSMMLLIAPNQVRMERAVPELPERNRPGPFTRDPLAERGLYSASGAFGDPTLASLEKGRVLVAGLVAHIVAEVRAFAAEDFVPRPLEAQA